MFRRFFEMPLADRVLCAVSVAFTAITWPFALVEIVNMLTMAIRGLR